MLLSSICITSSLNVLGTGQPDHHSVTKILHSQGSTPLRTQPALTHCLLPALSQDVKEHSSAWDLTAAWLYLLSSMNN